MYDNEKNNDSIKVELSDGTIILMDYTDVNSQQDGPVTVQNLTIAADKTFKVIKSFANDIKTHIKAAKPDKASIEFSIELEKKDGDLFSKICNVSGKSGVKITLEWDFSKSKPEQDA